MKIAILGAGNVAQANACYLASNGHDIHVWSAIARERDELSRAGRIGFDGCMSGRATITVTVDVASCIEDAAAVMIAAAGLRARDAVAPAVRDRDFFAEGHTVEKLGLGGFDNAGILLVSADGF